MLDQHRLQLDLRGAAGVLEPVGEGGVALGGEEERVGHLPLAQVGEHRLPEGAGVAGEVEDVVDDLEGEPQVGAVLLEGPALLVGEVPGPGAGEERPAEELGGLPVDHREVVVHGAAEEPAVLQLQRLADQHRPEQAEHPLHQLRDPRRLDALEALHQQPVAGVDRGGVAEDHPGGGRTAAALAEIHHVVVEQGRVVHQLRGGGQVADDRRVAGAAAGGQRHAHRAEALPLEAEQVPDAAVHRRLAVLHRAEHRLDVGEIDPHVPAQVLDPSGHVLDLPLGRDGLQAPPEFSGRRGAARAGDSHRFSMG